MSRKEISVSTLYGHTSFVHSIAFNHDNTLIVSGSFDNLIKIWKVYQSKCVMTFGGHEAWVTSVAFNPNGTKIVSVLYQSKIIYHRKKMENQAHFSNNVIILAMN